MRPAHILRGRMKGGLSTLSPLALTGDRKPMRIDELTAGLEATQFRGLFDGSDPTAISGPPDTPVVGSSRQQ